MCSFVLVLKYWTYLSTAHQTTLRLSTGDTMHKRLSIVRQSKCVRGSLCNTAALAEGSGPGSPPPPSSPEDKKECKCSSFVQKQARRIFWVQVHSKTESWATSFEPQGEGASLLTHIPSITTAPAIFRKFHKFQTILNIISEKLWISKIDLIIFWKMFPTLHLDHIASG